MLLVNVGDTLSAELAKPTVDVSLAQVRRTALKLPHTCDLGAPSSRRILVPYGTLNPPQTSLIVAGL